MNVLLVYGRVQALYIGYTMVDFGSCSRVKNRNNIFDAKVGM